MGKDFDAVIVDVNTIDSKTDFIAYKNMGPLELLQKFIYSGDDRNIVNVYVNGQKVK